jgi:phage protein D
MSEDNFREVYGWVRTQDEAKASAKSAAKRIQSSKASVDITMPGRIDIVAGMHITLTGFRDGVNGKWKAVTVRHTISRSGWLTAITGEAAQ